MTYRCLGILAMTLLSVAVPARAQEEASQARTLFEEGLELADHGDWPTAAARFEGAIALRDTPPIRYNLARCLDHLGRFVDAIAQLDALQNGGPAPASIRQSAQRLRSELEPRIGRVIIQLRGEADGMVVAIDRRVLSRSELDQPILVDPGTRHVTLAHDGDTIDDVDVIVAEGGVSHLVLGSLEPTRHAEPIPTLASTPVLAPTGALPSPPPPLAPAHEPGVEETWWFWTLVGVGVVGIGLGIGLGVGLSGSPGPSMTGDFDPGVVRIGG